ncbi:flagellar biosynthetic protein FliO [Entomohabitans teleogrylli]|uniref:flagellar biosynthetic protein FliO n=1 Tax=Entomohabitans teleogrylli TaxID=1384589 RepID=UPI00073D1C80|nr:flagellar biosynthetic protein FliO [Entomohabitans teleogrylli]
MKNPLSGEMVGLAPALDSAAPGALLFDVGGALALILLFIAAVAWIVRRAGLAPGAVRGHKPLKVTSSQLLGPRERVVIVEVEGKRLLLGVTSSHISYLATLGKEEASDPLPGTLPERHFQRLLDRILRKNRPEPAS